MTTLAARLTRIRQKTFTRIRRMRTRIGHALTTAARSVSLTRRRPRRRPRQGEGVSPASPIVPELVQQSPVTQPPSPQPLPVPISLLRGFGPNRPTFARPNPDPDPLSVFDTMNMTRDVYASAVYYATQCPERAEDFLAIAEAFTQRIVDRGRRQDGTP